MFHSIDNVDICCGLCWGDEAKGKIVSNLSKNGNYDFVCRWAGGNNAGHTIYIAGVKYKTHLIPSGVFYNIKSIIGPGCVVNIDSFFDELEYLKKNGFNTSIIKISPKAHVITNEHLQEDKEKYKHLGTTSKGIAPSYRDKYSRVGKRISDYSDILGDYIWDEKLYGNILCEGAQGTWLDIDYGNYPYITSSCTMPYSACSLGFPPQLIRDIYGAAKIYDTRSGVDPDFPTELLENHELKKIGEVGEEYGTTTGRKRIVNYLNLDKLIESINLTGTTKIIISKVDVLNEVKIFKCYYKEELKDCVNMETMMNYIEKLILSNCSFVKSITFSDNKETV